MHEILTLQLGQQSNYLATHFWNAQESYFTYGSDQESPIDHDVHWRPGIGVDGVETFMPRTVVYDLKGGFGSLRQINALYDATDPSQAPESQGLWPGQAIVHRQAAITPSPYQTALDAGAAPPPLTPQTVRYWSDYNRVFYHPRSLVQLHDYELHSSIAPFERFATGQELFRTLDREHDLLDRDLRPFAEEADHMQGIQLFASWDDAWGGFAADYTERLRDEYGKTSVWVWGLQDNNLQGIPRAKRVLRLANKARALVELYKQASVVVPLAVPSRLPSRILALNAASLWHTSALLAAAVESAMLPTRLKDPARRDTLGSMADLLNVMGKQNVAGLQMSFAAAPHEDEAQVVAQDSRIAETSGEDEDLSLDLDFSPADRLDPLVGRQNGFAQPRVFSQALMRRGTKEGGPSEGDDAEDGERNRNRSAYHSPLAFPILDSFPRIFQGEEGELQGPLSITTALSTNTAVSGQLKQLRTSVTRSFGIEDREALENDLAGMAEEYHEGWSSGSDDGDDE